MRKPLIADANLQKKEIPPHLAVSLIIPVRNGLFLVCTLLLTALLLATCLLCALSCLVACCTLSLVTLLLAATLLLSALCIALCITFCLAALSLLAAAFCLLLTFIAACARCQSEHRSYNCHRHQNLLHSP